MPFVCKVERLDLKTGRWSRREKNGPGPGGVNSKNEKKG